ncbi:hypothetical protein ACVAMH_34370, partial [Bacillus zanthoxyli]
MKRYFLSLLQALCIPLVLCAGLAAPACARAQTAPQGVIQGNAPLAARARSMPKSANAANTAAR